MPKSKRSEAGARRLTKSYEEHLTERLRTPVDVALYLQGALETIENYSPKEELAALSIVVQDAIRALRAMEKENANAKS